MENRHIQERLPKNPDQSGVIVIMAAGLMIVFCGILAMAVDIGQLVWVKGELEKAADAGALSGARALTPYTGSPLKPNWSEAQTMATQTVRQNSAAGQTLADCQVQAGYWSLATKTLQAMDLTPAVTDVPAIRVIVAKRAGNNGGPLQMLFAPVLGFQALDVQAQVTAMVSFPRGMTAGSIFPLATAETIVNQYWTRDPPVSFQIGSGSANGNWTSFKVNNNSSSYVAGLITGGNPTSLNLNDTIWIQPGVKSTNYGNAAPYVGQTVIIPLVNADMTSQVNTPILGFAAFRIEAVNQNSKYIRGHFDKNFTIANATIIGAPATGTQGTPNPPKIIQ